MQNKLTIILTLKDRAEFTYRWMRYMNDMHCPYKILVADGGKDRIIERHLQELKNYPNLDYEYIRYPYDATIEDYYAKFENVVSKVKSEYLLLADNDDFYLLERIPEIINFLDSHQDCSGARGKLVYLDLFDRTGASGRLVNGMRYLAFVKESASIESESPYERVESLCANMCLNDYYANWYCVFRTRTFREAWEFLITLPVKEVVVTEILTHVLMVMSGKIKILPFPFYIRQSSTSSVADTLVAGNEFLERCLIDNGLSEFRIAIDQFFAAKSKEERDRIIKAVASWLEIFIANIYVARTSIKKGFLRSLRKRIKMALLTNRQIAKNYHYLLRLFFPWRKMKPLRLRMLEPYILEYGN